MAKDVAIVDSERERFFCSLYGSAGSLNQIFAPSSHVGYLENRSDSGPGLDPERLDHLFDAFFSTKPHGLGIGLTITRSIVDAHGGRVSAKANLPRRAVFEFTLPVNAAGAQPSNQSGGSGK